MIEDFWEVLNNDKSLFARHRMYPTAFFYSWQIRLIKKWIDGKEINKRRIEKESEISQEKSYLL